MTDRPGTDILGHLSREVARGRLDRRAFLGRAAALGVGAGLANALIAGAARAQGPVRGGTLRLGMQGGQSTDSLDPASWAGNVAIVWGATYTEPMFNVTPEGGLDPRLVEEWSASEDASTWTFRIRGGVEFHDGQKMTADDVLATLERHSQEDSQSGALGVMRGIKDMRVDGRDLMITTTEPNADLPYLLSDYHLGIQPNGGKDDPNAGIGTGAYKVSVFEPGVRMVGERFENYWDLENRGFADQVELVVINDSTARTSALQSGQVHMINRVEPRLVELVKRIPGVEIRNIAGPGHYVFIMHCDTAPFDNYDLRMALKLAMNREEMVDKILAGYGTLGNDFPINQAYPLFPDDIEQRTYDPEQAAFHYKKSGHEGSVLLRTSEVAFPGAVDAAQLFQQSAAAAGITIDIRREPGDGYWSDVWNVQPFCTSYWGGRPVQDQMYATAYLSTADWNDTRFKDVEFDKMLLSARGELDEGKRKAVYRDMALLVRDQGGVILPMFNDFIDATGPNVGGWVSSPTRELMGSEALSKCWVTS